jgi:perosamine synthetase
MIPVCEPLLAGREWEYVRECLETNWISSIGKYVSEFEQKFAEYCGCRHGVSTTSGTTALHLTLAALGIGKGDEVIVPSFTMIAPVFAVVYTGAKPVLVDSEPDTWTMDVTKVEGKITPRTRAIIPVHIYGHPCDMGPILGLAEKYGLWIVEDAAEAHGAEYEGKKAGGIGHVGCFSFYANKIITTGEGGMLVTNDERIADNARRLKDQAYSREKRFLHTDIGFNYRMTNIQAAIGLAQFERIDELVEKRRKNARLYNDLLKDAAGITLPVEKEWAKNVYWMYSILIQSEFGMTVDDLMKKLGGKGIQTRSFFVPMHQQPAFNNLGLFKSESYPVAEEVSRKGMYLPSGTGLSADEIIHICSTIERVRQEVKL